MNANSIKAKVAGLVDKVTDSKLYKAVEKGAVMASASLTMAGVSAMNVFAAEGSPSGITIDVEPGLVLTNAEPFLNPAVKVLCIVGGLKLGANFFKRSFH